MNWIICTAVLLQYMAASGYSDCRSASEGDSKSCVDITACAALLETYRKVPRSSEDAALLQRSMCGYSGTTPKVCCSSNTCTTPDGTAGCCISVCSCPHLLALLKLPKPLPMESFNTLQRSRCELDQPVRQPSDYKVCCGESGRPTLTESVMAVAEDSCVNSTDPVAGCCGRRVFDGFWEPDGDATGLDLFPWSALIEYQDLQDNSTKLLCGGALISSHYVLTVAHCVTGPLLTGLVAVNVRLGEHDTRTEVDCVRTSDVAVDCADPHTVVPIERTQAHPEYSPGSSARSDDIALLRLARHAVFTDFIKPICLPTSDVTVSFPLDLKLHAVVFEEIATSPSVHLLKKHVELPYWSLQQCRAIFRPIRANIALSRKQLCAGGVEGQDACGGGGILMYKRQAFYEIVGLVSFGPRPCGRRGVPTVYTKVYEYVDWIRSQMEG